MATLTRYYRQKRRREQVKTPVKSEVPSTPTKPEAPKIVLKVVDKRRSSSKKRTVRKARKTSIDSSQKTLESAWNTPKKRDSRPRTRSSSLAEEIDKKIVYDVTKVIRKEKSISNEVHSGESSSKENRSENTPDVSSFLQNLPSFKGTPRTRRNATSKRDIDTKIQPTEPGSLKKCERTKSHHIDFEGEPELEGFEDGFDLAVFEDVTAEALQESEDVFDGAKPAKVQDAKKRSGSVNKAAASYLDLDPFSDDYTPITRPKSTSPTSGSRRKLTKDVGKPPLASSHSKSSKYLRSELQKRAEQYAERIGKRKLVIDEKRLPLSFDRLRKQHTSMQTAMSYYLSRQCFFVLFDDLKQSIETITRREFLLEDLQRILSVLPDGYTTKYIKFEGRGIQKPSYKLSVSLNGIGTSSGKTFVTSTEQFDRREKFDKQLKHTVMEHYKKFRKDHDLPILDEENLDYCNAFHNTFPFEKTPLPPLKTLPEPSKEKQSEVLAFSRSGKGTQLDDKKIQRQLREALGYKNGEVGNLDGVSEAVKNAVEAGSKPDEQPSPTKAVQAPVQKVVTKGLRGLSPALLAKIRNKSATRKVLTSNPQHKEKLRTLDALPRLASLIREIFHSSRRTAMPFHLLKKQIMERSQNLTSRESLSTQLTLLLEVAGFWCRLIGKNKDIFKVEMKTNIRCVKDAIRKAGLKLKSQE